jgi:hypothetical protein
LTAGCTVLAAPSIGAGLDTDALARYVLGRRTSAGGYSFYRVARWGVEEPSAPDTLAALGSLRLLGLGPPHDSATVRWLRDLQLPNGGYPTRVIGWAALLSLDLLGASPRTPAARWAARWAGTVGVRKGDQAWRAVLADAAHLTDVLQLGGGAITPDVVARLAAVLGRARAPTGAWARPEADLETTGTAGSLAAAAGTTVRDRGSEDFLRSCEDPAFGFRVRPDARATSVGALRGGLWLCGAWGVPVRYPVAVAGALARLQRADGGLGARDRAISTLQATWTGLRAARLLDDGQVPAGGVRDAGLWRSSHQPELIANRQSAT